VRIAPDVPAAHPAFDVTPHRYIAAIFTERGVAKAPYTESLRKLADAVPAKAASWGVELSWAEGPGEKAPRPIPLGLKPD